MANVTMDDLMPRVEKGAAWLDGEVPDWFTRVNLAKLEMSSCVRCVLGQSCDGYFRVVSRVDPEHGVESRTISPWALARGFVLDYCETTGPVGINEPEWKLLLECWITAILTRRHQQVEQQQDQPVPAEAAQEQVR